MVRFDKNIIRLNKIKVTHVWHVVYFLLLFQKHMKCTARLNVANCYPQITSSVYTCIVDMKSQIKIAVLKRIKVHNILLLTFKLPFFVEAN